MPTALLDRPAPSTGPAPPEPREPAAATGGASRPPRWPGSGGGGGGRRPRGRREEISIPVAAIVTALIGALFTFLGILTQIWANIAGTQLPGA